MARKAKAIKAVSYLRTSSAANVGENKDSDKRQRAAIEGYARANGFEIVAEFYDPAVKGEDRIETRPGFAALLDRIESNGVRTVIIDEVSRFARELLTQELGIIALAHRGVTVITTSGDDLTNSTDPMKVFMRQVAGAFSQLEKARLIAKLRVARERKRANGQKVEGRKSIAEKRPDTVLKAKKLEAAMAEALPKGRQPPLRDVAKALADAGHMTPNGLPYSPSAMKRMLGRQR